MYDSFNRNVIPII